MAKKPHKKGNWTPRDMGSAKDKATRRKMEKRIERGEGYDE